MKTKLITAEMSVTTYLKPWTEEEKKLKKKHRKPKQAEARFRATLIIEFVDQLRLSEPVNILGLGNFIVTQKDRLLGLMELKSTSEVGTNVKMSFYEEIEIANIGYMVGEGSSHPTPQINTTI